MLKTFVIFLGHIVHNMLFLQYYLCSLKVNFESIIIPSSVTDEADFMVISPICNVCEPVFPRIINWNL